MAFRIADWRAFMYGTLGSAALLAMAEFVAGTAMGFRGALFVVTGSCLIGGISAGLIVGFTNTKMESPFSEAGVAALLGTILSLFGWLGLLVVIAQMSVSQALDAALFVFGLSAPLLLFVGPITYAVAGFIASSIVGGESQFGKTGARGLK